MAESLCCSLETTGTLLIGYTPILYIRKLKTLKKEEEEMSSHSQPQWICSTSNLIHSLGWGDPGEDPNPDLMAAASKLQRSSLQGRIQYEADQI